ncbi:MAG TPA: Hpt domain-containing protein [Solirubrobacteraceae bacterium]|nr:Hpt domain-containing protein [Solirubrobacteraceae bacterium]
MRNDEADVLDRAMFDDFAGLFGRGELRDMIEEWRTDTAIALDAIADALARGDRARVGEIAHRTAGGALALGAMALARASERLRAGAESGGTVADDVAAARDAAAVTYAAMTRAAGL